MEVCKKKTIFLRPPVKMLNWFNPRATSTVHEQVLGDIYNAKQKKRSKEHANAVLKSSVTPTY